jgi:glycosyltransferase involved in cell wall biosynthesis
VTRRPEAPSFEKRFREFFAPLERRGIRCEPRTIPRGLRALRRFRRELRGFDGVWWHRYLPAPWAARAWRAACRRIVFDFDDPISLPSRGGSWRKALTRRIKFARWLRRCDAALAGSSYLARLAAPHCPSVHVVPMAIDVNAQSPPPARDFCRSGLLWLGSRSTLRYLDDIADSLRELGRQRPGTVLRLVGHEDRDFAPLRVDFRPWSPGEQAAGLNECSVGLCPLPDTPWTRGKCPYKALQYMAAGMAWAGSEVGELRVLAGEGEATARGRLVAEGGDWARPLADLLSEPAEARRLGEASRSWVLAHRTREAVAELLARQLREALED